MAPAEKRAGPGETILGGGPWALPRTGTWHRGGKFAENPPRQKSIAARSPCGQVQYNTFREFVVHDSAHR